MMIGATWETAKEPSSSSAPSFSFPLVTNRILFKLYVLCAILSLIPCAMYSCGYMTTHKSAVRESDQTISNASTIQHLRRPSLMGVNGPGSSERVNATSGILRLDYNVTGERDSLKPVECFAPGTVPGLGKRMCVCRDGWHGGDCAVPSAVWSTPVFRKWYSEGLITRRSRPRAVFNGISLNHELDMLEIHVNELSDAVDRYVVVESNTTFFGDAKPLYLQSNLNAGFLGEHAHKIVPLTVGEQKCNGCDPFWQEYHSRNATWLEGQRWLGNISDDDLFLLTDADELPNRDVVLFLKHHDGYGEPIGLTLRWFLYGFFWERRSAMHVYAVCTVGFLRTVCANDPVTLRQGRCLVPKLPSPIHRPRPTVPVLVGTGTVAHQWVIQGARPRFSGWHCSWCFNAQGIQYKLKTAQRDDGVRWGDLAENTDLAYIESLRKSGRFFDERKWTISADGYDTAPAHVIKNKERLLYLLEP